LGRWPGLATSAVHRLTVGGGYNDVLVLRQYERDLLPLLDNGTAALMGDEAGTLRAVHDAGLPAPEPIAADADGRETGGHPAILMTRLPGRPDLAPADPEGWLRQIAAMAVRIHAVEVAAPPPFRSRIDAPNPVVPASATRPAVWSVAPVHPGPGGRPRSRRHRGHDIPGRGPTRSDAEPVLSTTPPLAGWRCRPASGLFPARTPAAHERRPASGRPQPDSAGAQQRRRRRGGPAGE
jgi:phosphotransferase family enzyme